MRDEQVRTGRQIVASIDSANSALASELGEQTRMLGALGHNLRGVGDEVLHLRYSLERGMGALHNEAMRQTALLSVIAQATLAPSRTKAQEFERRAFSLLERGLFAEAQSEAGRSLEEEPYQWGAHHVLGQVSEALGEPDEATERYKLAARYAAGVTPRQQALSLSALAKISLAAGEPAEAERYAREAYEVDQTPERLYASAVYLAATADPAGDASVEDRLFQAVIRRPGLAVLAMAEPRLVARSDARDAALLRVRDMMEARVQYSLSCLNELVNSLDGFLKHHRTLPTSEVHTYVRAAVAAANGDELFEQRYGEIVSVATRNLLYDRDKLIGPEATVVVERIRADRETVTTAIGELTIESLRTVHEMLPPMLDHAEENLKRMAQDVEKQNRLIMGAALHGERFINENSATIRNFGVSSKKREEYVAMMGRVPAFRAEFEYLDQVRQYYCQTAKYIEAVRPEITRALD